MILDQNSEYLYMTDAPTDRIIRVKMDGSGYQTLGSFGSGQGQFNLCYGGGIEIDSATEFIYIADSCNKRIVKTRIDGSGWTTYSETGEDEFEPFHLKLDSDGNLYFLDRYNSRLIKTKFGGAGFESLDLSGATASPGVFDYDEVSGFFYIANNSNSTIFKIKFDGSGYQSYGSQGSGSNQFRSISGIKYLDSYLYISDMENHRIIKTQFGGTGWQAYGAQGTGTAKFIFPGSININVSSDDLFVLNSSYRGPNSPAIIKTKIDGSGWTTYALAGSGTNSDSSALALDEATGDYYTTGPSEVIRSQRDGTNWKVFGNQGDSTNGTFNSIAGLAIDPSNDYVYTVDHYNNGLTRFKMDGSDWSFYKGPNGNDFSTPTGLAFDKNTGFAYAGAMYNCQIIKTKFDGTGFETFGSCGDDPGEFGRISEVRFDDITGFIYACDYDHNRITRFKMNGGDPEIQVLDTSPWSTYGMADFIVETGSDYVYFNTDSGGIVRVKMDGTDERIIDTTVWPTTIFYDWVSPLLFESVSNTLIVSDGRNLFRITPEGEYVEEFNLTHDKTLFKTSGTNPFELGVSAYNGKFNLSFNKYNLPIKLSETLNLSAGSWHSMLVSFDQATGTMQAYLDGAPIIDTSAIDSQLKSMIKSQTINDFGEFIYIGSDPDDKNKAFPGAIDDVEFGLPDPTSTNLVSAIPKLLELPATGRFTWPKIW